MSLHALVQQPICHENNTKPVFFFILKLLVLCEHWHAISDKWMKVQIYFTKYDNMSSSTVSFLIRVLVYSEKESIINWTSDKCWFKRRH
jgi:hypothetical protein